MNKSSRTTGRHYTSSSPNPPDASQYEARIAALERLVVSQALEIERLRSGGFPERDEAIIPGTDARPVPGSRPKAPPS